MSFTVNLATIQDESSGIPTGGSATTLPGGLENNVGNDVDLAAVTKPQILVDAVTAYNSPGLDRLMQPFPFKAALAAVILMSVPGAALSQPAPAAAPEFTIERRKMLRRVWQSDAAIRDYVEPGDSERLDTYSDYYSEDYTARQSSAPELPVVAAWAAAPDLVLAIASDAPP
jgi:hypothetical protein